MLLDQLKIKIRAAAMIETDDQVEALLPKAEDVKERIEQFIEAIKAEYPDLVFELK